MSREITIAEGGCKNGHTLNLVNYDPFTGYYRIRVDGLDQGYFQEMPDWRVKAGWLLKTVPMTSHNASVEWEEAFECREPSS